MDCIVRIECDTCAYDNSDPAKFASCPGCGHTLCIRCLEQGSVSSGIFDHREATVVSATGVAERFLRSRNGVQYCPACYTALAV